MWIHRRKAAVIWKCSIACVGVLVILFIVFHPSDLEPEAVPLDEGPYIPLDTKDPPREGVVLLEGYGSPRLTPRMWCAVESAARAHPHAKVSLLMTSTIIKDTPLMRDLKKELPNLQLLHLDPSRLFEDSLLEVWYQQKRWEKSYWPRSHFNDVLRWMILKRYGGIYLDLDVVVVRSLSSLPNCTGLESTKYAAAGVLKFSPEHPVVEGCVESIAEHFDGTVWGANGPELITDVLKRVCGMKLPSGETPNCPDVTVLPSRAFYPIPWWDWKRYVTEDDALSRELLDDPSVYVLHVWNLHTRHARVALNSYQPYAHAARIQCPSTVLQSGPYM